MIPSQQPEGLGAHHTRAVYQNRQQSKHKAERPPMWGMCQGHTKNSKAHRLGSKQQNVTSQPSWAAAAARWTVATLR
jgi:hypothetical protein